MITRDDWLKALSEAKAAPLPPSDPSVVTINEFAVMLGKDGRAARIAMRQLVDAGRAERTSKVIQQVSGYPRAVPAYRLLPHGEA